MRSRASIFVLALALTGWVRPRPPASAQPAKDAAQRLDYMIVLVNDEPRLVPAGGELAIMRGDRVQVKQAVLKDRARRVRAVTVTGVSSLGPRRSDDRGYAFTTEELQPRHSEAGKGDLYLIAATSRRLLHGTISLHILQPVLRFAEITINGTPHILRDGEPLTMRASDQVKVARIVTNLPVSDGVFFQIEGDAATGAYAIYFRRGGEPFAKVPLKVTD